MRVLKRQRGREGRGRSGGGEYVFGLLWELLWLQNPPPLGQRRVWSGLLVYLCALREAARRRGNTIGELDVGLG